jgi:hypothetical protein
VSLTLHARFLRFCDHISANLEQNLAQESFALGVLFDEKNKGRKSRETAPLSCKPNKSGKKKVDAHRYLHQLYYTYTL